MLRPELGLCGYPPEDLLLRPAFMRACAEALADCARRLADLPGLFVVVGHPHQLGSSGDVRSNSVAVSLRFNAASVLSEGRVVATYCKRELPNYQVFDERRYFASGRDADMPALVFTVEGLRFGLVICEDAWFDKPGELACSAGAQALCVVNASPFHLGKMVEREEPMAIRARWRCRSSTPTLPAARTRSSSTAPRSPSSERRRRRAREDVRGGCRDRRHRSRRRLGSRRDRQAPVASASRTAPSAATGAIRSRPGSAPEIDPAPGALP
ncbi:MAG TPA: nitrilase-related carbon-nitrogen hydrolase [Caldimonas sp.]|nr:nitrilase-related carbon-nitrogen hydrolase [Caldimonas sp.]HEV7577744.1 nitrilase-related carbon-nitrogen hydrolase [Caldimonas sp.]